MKNQKAVPALFWTGFIIAVALATVGTWSLMQNLRTLTMEELDTTIWAEGGPLFILWALSVTLGSILAGIGAFLYVKTRPLFSWFAAIGVLGAVLLMVMVWSRVYDPTLFGIGGIISLIAFFAIVWIWMKRYAGLEMPEKVAGSFKLLGYIFWINASWFMCGESGKMHLKAYEGAPAPSPIEVMVFLALGWLFVLVGEYSAMRLRQSQADRPQADRKRAVKKPIPQFHG